MAEPRRDDFPNNFVGDLVQDERGWVVVPPTCWPDRHGYDEPGFLRQAAQNEGAVGALRFVQAINRAGQRRSGPLEKAQRLHVHRPSDANVNI